MKKQSQKGKKKKKGTPNKYLLSLDEPQWAGQVQPSSVQTELSWVESLVLHNEAMAITSYISLSVTAGRANSLTRKGGF